MSYHLIDVVQRLGRPRLLVLGDLILDRYIWGEAERVSQEAPVILLRQESQEARLGGAANVANMLRGLDAQVVMAGVIGQDADGVEVRKQMEENGVDCAALVCDPSRPTTVKERYIGRAQHRHPHQMLRVDREVRRPIDASIEDQLLTQITAHLSRCDAVLVSDYAKGVCTDRVLSQVIEKCRQLEIPVIVDPASTGECEQYTGATAITPNRLETQRATGIQIETIEDAFQAGRLLCSKLGLEYAFVTIDSDGIAFVRRDGTGQHLATRKREVYDITGAGDMVLATIGVGAAAGISPPDLGRLANISGGLEVEHVGVVNVSRDEMIADLLAGGRTSLDKVSPVDEAVRHVEARRKLGQKVVFTNGCFDVLHVGHIEYLQQAAGEGDCLIVGLNSDDSVRRQGKGDDRPVFGEAHRARMLAALEAVDYVVVFDADTPCELLEQLRPDLLVKGGTYSEEQIVGREIVTQYGGQVKALGEVPGLSTTEILKRIRQPQPAPIVMYPDSQSGRKAG